MTREGIADGEPPTAELSLIGTPVAFWHQGREHQATVSKAGTSADRIFRTSPGGYRTLSGEFGRAWVADPCSMILFEAVRAGRHELLAQRRQDREAKKRLKGG